MEEEEKYRIIRHQMLKRRRNAQKILRHTDVLQGGDHVALI